MLSTHVQPQNILKTFRKRLDVTDPLTSEPWCFMGVQYAFFRAPLFLPQSVPLLKGTKQNVLLQFFLQSNRSRASFRIRKRYCLWLNITLHKNWIFKDTKGTHIVEKRKRICITYISRSYLVCKLLVMTYQVSSYQ